MAEKKSTSRKGTAADAPVVPPASPAGPPAADAKPAATPAPPAAAEPDGKPTGTQSAAARMLTRSIAVKKPAAARGDAQRVADATKPSQKPVAGAGRRGPRRGASKGR